MLRLLAVLFLILLSPFLQGEISQETLARYSEPDQLTLRQVADIQNDMITLDNGIVMQLTDVEYPTNGIKKMDPGALRAGDLVTVVWHLYDPSASGAPSPQATTRAPIGLSLNLYKREGELTVGGYNVKPISFDNALGITEIKRQENLPEDGWRGYKAKLSDGTEWEGWFSQPNEGTAAYAAGDKVIWAYIATPGLTPGNLNLVNLSKKDSHKYSGFGAAKYVQEMEEGNTVP